MSVPLPGSRMTNFTTRELDALRRAFEAAERAGPTDTTSKSLMAQVDDELRRRRRDPFDHTWR